MVTWKKQSKFWRPQWFITRYHIACSVEKIQKVKTQRLKKKVKLILLSKCALCDSKKLRFIKTLEASGLFSNLAIRTPFSKIQVLGNILFCRYKMNKIVKKFSLAGDKIILEMQLRQPVFT